MSYPCRSRQWAVQALLHNTRLSSGLHQRDVLGKWTVHFKHPSDLQDLWRRCVAIVIIGYDAMMWCWERFTVGCWGFSGVTELPNLQQVGNGYGWQVETMDTMVSAFFFSLVFFMTILKCLFFSSLKKISPLSLYLLLLSFLLFLLLLLSFLLLLLLVLVPFSLTWVRHTPPWLCTMAGTTLTSPHSSMFPCDLQMTTTHWQIYKQMGNHWRGPWLTSWSLSGAWVAHSTVVCVCMQPLKNTRHHTKSHSLIHWSLFVLTLPVSPFIRIISV